MPKYFCDYCETFLTHDSPSVRKTHNMGKKHKENVRSYYNRWMEDQAQALIDKTVKDAERRMKSNPYFLGPSPSVPMSAFVNPMVPAPLLPPPTGIPLPDGTIVHRPPMPPPPPNMPLGMPPGMPPMPPGMPQMFPPPGHMMPPHNPMMPPHPPVPMQGLHMMQPGQPSMFPQMTNSTSANAQM